jgi:hypothetical protein
MSYGGPAVSGERSGLGCQSIIDQTLSQGVANLRQCNRESQCGLWFHSSEQGSNRMLHGQVLRKRMGEPRSPLVVIDHQQTTWCELALEYRHAFFGRRRVLKDAEAYDDIEVLVGYRQCVEVRLHDDVRGLASVAIGEVCVDGG